MFTLDSFVGRGAGSLKSLALLVLLSLLVVVVQTDQNNNNHQKCVFADWLLRCVLDATGRQHVLGQDVYGAQRTGCNGRCQFGRFRVVGRLLVSRVS